MTFSVSSKLNSTLTSSKLYHFLSIGDLQSQTNLLLLSRSIEIIPANSNFFGDCSSDIYLLRSIFSSILNLIFNIFINRINFRLNQHFLILLTFLAIKSYFFFSCICIQTIIYRNFIFFICVIFPSN